MWVNYDVSNFDDIKHCLISSKFDMWVENVEFVLYCGGHFENGNRYTFFNVANQFGTSLSTHISNFDDIRQCLIFAAILKMATAKIFSMLGINLKISTDRHFQNGHHNTCKNSTLSYII
jgi:hypothetical protein